MSDQVLCPQCGGWFLPGQLHPCPKWNRAGDNILFVMERNAPMTMEPGTSKVDLYNDCTEPLCQHPIGKAHVHQGNWTNIHQVVVRREPPKPTKEDFIKQLSIDMSCLELAPTNSDQRHTARMMIRKLEAFIKL